MMPSRWIALFLLTTCATYTPPPVAAGATRDLDVASAAAWESYMAKGSPPHVEIVTEMTCRNSPGTPMSGFGCIGVDHPGCVCLAGDETWWAIRVGRVNEQPWHETALCHELLHRYLETTTGDANPGHVGLQWSVPLDACNGRLVEAGY
jgi:hypothetical protein